MTFIPITAHRGTIFEEVSGRLLGSALGGVLAGRERSPGFVFARRSFSTGREVLAGQERSPGFVFAQRSFSTGRELLAGRE